MAISLWSGYLRERGDESWGLGKRRNYHHLECHCPELHLHLPTLALHCISYLRLKANPVGSAWGL